MAAGGVSPLPGVSVGHWTHPSGRTGCTVVLLPEGTVASVEVRGGAPASRELDLLAPERMVEGADAVVLSGGSAFGLASADGVVRHCREAGRGFPTPAGPPLGTGTTIGVILTNVRLSKTQCLLVAQSGHDGLARALMPAHTRFNGDALIAASVGTLDASLDAVRVAATVAVDDAVRAAVGSQRRAGAPGDPPETAG